MQAARQGHLEVVTKLAETGMDLAAADNVSRRHSIYMFFLYVYLEI